MLEDIPLIVALACLSSLFAQGQEFTYGLKEAAVIIIVM